MIRRSQNRGYATLARIADHLEQLAVGDESNAAIDAHRRGQPDDRARRQGARVPDRVRRQHGSRHRRFARADPRRRRRRAARRRWRSPTISPRRTRTSPAREREETKRLLYVALTRARDRLYLSAIAGQEWLQAHARSARGGAARAGAGAVLTRGRRRRADVSGRTQTGLSTSSWSPCRNRIQNSEL